MPSTAAHRERDATDPPGREGQFASDQRTVFGPIGSRRLGRSLGVDPLPFKTCDWNCVYCQLGRTLHATTERRPFVSAESVEAELRDAVRHHVGEIDWITFAGSGEPTLHAQLGRLIRFARRLDVAPVAVITNGSLLHRADVREDLIDADAVLPTVNAGSAALHQRIHRPARSLLFSQFVAGLTAFRRMYNGSLWVEVMLLRGVNDGADALRDLAGVLAQIRPDAIHLMLPVRPPAEAPVRSATLAGVERAVAALRGIARVVVPGDAATFDGVDAPADVDLARAIPGVVQRHPLSLGELLRLFPRAGARRIVEALTGLEEHGLLRQVERFGRPFWVCANAQFALVAETSEDEGRN